jgi:hypothetical protein
VGTVVRSVLDEFLDDPTLTPAQRRTLLDLAGCRTAALGGHILQCSDCGHVQIAYNSCGNRHCPTCQGTDAARWLEEQAADLLPVPYFHLVFTLPDALNGLALGNPRVVYDLLLRCAAETVLSVAADPRHLGARAGLLTVLHTWGQTLQLHPHVHCIVPGGGLSKDGASWVSSRPHFFLPVQVLSRVFRGKFLEGLRAAYARGQLHVTTPRSDPASAAAVFERAVAKAVHTDWVVYAKPPFGGPEQVLKYLARYTHRVAISNGRILDFEDGVVRIRYKDYVHGNRNRVLTLWASEFVRRFLLHVLPGGFVRIRRYGLLANRHRRMQLARCRELLACGATADAETQEPVQYAEGSVSVTPTRICPHCGAGRLTLIGEFPPLGAGARLSMGIDTNVSVGADSS